ncbi:MAG: type I restriction enzyme subunit R domain-containing protein [Candidatus Phytoplasma sp. TWB_XP]
MDECHRSQGGQMIQDIKKRFEKAQFIGFTGTPIFAVDENDNTLTTKAIFKNCLHKYVTVDAICDKNVLKWLVSYYKDADKEQHNNPKRIEEIVQNIIKNHTRINYSPIGKQFNAVLVTDSIDSLIKYYKEFQKQEHKLKIAAIYNHKVENDTDREDKKEHNDFFKNTLLADYNSIYRTSHKEFKYYFKDICQRFKNKDKREINILIVVRMFLTGYDSEFIQTLYIADSLKRHLLI